MAVALTPQRRVLAMAASQIGYSRWTDPLRGTKYARETQPVFWPRDTWLLANGISFCDLGVTWTVWKALGKDFVLNHLPGGASYNTDYRASKGGRVSKSEAAPGDILVFDWNWATASTNHVGFLEKRLSGARFQTIEFNTSPGSGGSQGNGGGVYRRVRRHDQVRYVLRPDWSKAGGGSDPVIVTPDTVPWKASNTIASLSKANVTVIQKLLKAQGYDLGSYGVDGSYGEATYNAVRAFQQAAGLAVDGVAGTNTQKALTAAPTSTSRPAPANPSPSKPTLKQLKVDGKLGPATAVALQEFLNSRGAKLKVDGKLGSKTWLALQNYLDAEYKDGEISRQSHRASEIGSAITSGWEYTGPGSSGSGTITLLQRWVGTTQDGIAGTATIKGLQRKLNVHGVGM